MKCLRLFYNTLLVGDVTELLDVPNLTEYFPDGKDGGMVGVGLGDEALLLRRWEIENNTDEPMYICTIMDVHV